SYYTISEMKLKDKHNSECLFVIYWSQIAISRDKNVTSNPYSVSKVDHCSGIYVTAGTDRNIARAASSLNLYESVNSDILLNDYVAAFDRVFDVCQTRYSCLFRDNQHVGSSFQQGLGFETCPAFRKIK